MDFEDSRAGPATGEVRAVQAPQKLRLNTVEASAYLRDVHGLKLAVATLEKLRCNGGGPAFVHFGRSVAYERTTLDEWIAARLSKAKRTTSELGDTSQCS